MSTAIKGNMIIHLKRISSLGSEVLTLTEGMVLKYSVVEDTKTTKYLFGRI
jgi:hypothetical protein